ncbi:uncharacterized protein LOC106660054 [Trichogramma pretiosum]|uniref:uncharacterized protein LOC106660054 n=1 Tax=Trichogramma pretiosum TaxID=7493 RepID=UPI0006C9758F|nr:uncharacterized protein LOC106660054 [Trichogramma pretiosum]
MPSADESNSSPSYLIEVMPAEVTSYHRQTTQSTQTFNSRDVDCLVTRLKKNLRLSNQQQQLKSSRPSMQQRLRRPTPYRLPTSRCPSEPPSFSRYRQRVLDVRHVEDSLDSFEHFQSLLRQGALIKEAVKRLRSSNDELSSTGIMGLDDEREDDEGASVKCFLGASICNSTTTIGSSSPNSSDNDDEDCCQDDEVTGLMCLM